jgi:hypothetical protein
MHTTQQSFLDPTKLILIPNFTLVTARTRRDLDFTGSSSPDDRYDSHSTLQTTDPRRATFETNLYKVFVFVRKENGTINVNVSYYDITHIATFRRIELT